MVGGDGGEGCQCLALDTDGFQALYSALQHLFENSLAKLVMDDNLTSLLLPLEQGWLFLTQQNSIIIVNGLIIISGREKKMRKFTYNKIINSNLS